MALKRIFRFQDDWYFKKYPLGTTLKEIINLTENFKIKNFERVDIPHDWLIESAKELPSGTDSTGWYRKVFRIEKNNSDKKYFLKFDGIYMDSTVYMNRQKVCERKNGYTAFEADLTPYIKDGENEILVSANYQIPNSRWYSGAGIYRSVFLKIVPQTHFVSEGTYIVTEKDSGNWFVKISEEVNVNQNCYVNCVIRERDTKKVVWSSNAEILLSKKESGEKKETQKFEMTAQIDNPQIWDLKTPFLYESVSELKDENGNISDTQSTRFGFRTISFNPQKGFFLNEKNVKFQGVCEHHDLGCLGAAFNLEAMKRRLNILKKMGANAIRISHNAPSAEIIELADEMGFLIATELYDMWEKPKTKYDFARFFSDWYKKDVASWVRRDRNSPSVILWSIGNEIYDTHASERGVLLTKMLMDEVHIHDPKQNAKVTLASNYMPWENTQNCADVVKIIGYNYSEKYYEEHHEKHPNWIIYGSETLSIVQSRGIYRFPQEKKILTDDDKQCSALGNSITSWGAPSIDSCIVKERDTAYSCGQFIWTGFDYIGEPTPYHTKSSYLGQIDTAGFPKDSYYIFQSAWTDYKTNPMVHIYPYWDFNDGQIIDINICSNAPEVELFKNGESLGRKKISHKNDTELTAKWKVPYEKGNITAVAYDENGNEISRQTRNSFEDAAKIKLTNEKKVLNADGRDLCFVTIEMLDKNGNPVENANNRVEVNVTGEGRLIGLDNGDSTDYDEYKGTSRRLFSGKLLAVIAATLESGEINLEVSSVGMETEKISLQSEKLENVSEIVGVSGISAVEKNKKRVRQRGICDEEIPIRKIEIICNGGNKLTKEKSEISLEAILYPKNATYQNVEWAVTDDLGIPSSLVEIVGIQSDGKKTALKALGDGNCRVRCMAQNGTDEMNIISQIELKTEGFGQLNFNPYEFVYGGAYSDSNGAIGNGNERGIATARDGKSVVGFENLDFGIYGSDEVTIPIFALSDDEYPIELWEGAPAKEGSTLIADIIYQKPSIWNVYQEEIIKLNKRLKGISSLYFVLKQKVHIKGFEFTKQNRGLEKIYATEADSIYGDTFTIKEAGICDIGNNVSLEFAEMDFSENGENGIKEITICGNSEIECNSIHIRFEDKDNNEQQLIEFTKTNGTEERIFKFSRKISGKQKVTFLFLPGSKFDFSWFKFG